MLTQQFFIGAFIGVLLVLISANLSSKFLSWKGVFNLVILFLLFYCGYIASSVFIDRRIDKLRPYLNETAVKVATEHALKVYKDEFVENESVRARKLHERDKIVKQYLQRLGEILEDERK